MRGFRYPIWTSAALLLAALLLLPLVYLLLAAFGGGEQLAKVAGTVLWPASRRTLVLLTGVAILTSLTGTGLAYLITFYRFPGRCWLAWFVVMPLALPPYIAAYGFVEFLDFTGPPQTMLRWILGQTVLADAPRITSRDYWFPDITSLGGAIFILSAVLYPYVFLSVRVAFALQGAPVAEVARTLGAKSWRVAFRVVIPLARPAMTLGAALCLMETLNDIGAVEFLGVRTLTFSILDVWQNRGSLSAAAGIAVVLFAFVALLIRVERQARHRAAYFERRTGRGQISQYPVPIPTVWGLVAMTLCALPPLVGFVVPLYPHVKAALPRWRQVLDERLLEALLTTVGLAFCAALATLLIALVLVYATRLNPVRYLRNLVQLASLGYAVPGTIIGIGLLVPILAFDNLLDSVWERLFGQNLGLLIFGSGAALIFGYAIRFMALAQGGIDSALQRISPNLDLAARTLGRGPVNTLVRVILPVIWPALLTAGLLVFIDAAKDLSATMILQPSGLNTLSMYIFGYASDGEIGRTGVPSLILVVLALIPAFLVAQGLERRTAQASQHISERI